MRTHIAALALLLGGCSLSSLSPVPPSTAAADACRDFTEDVLAKMRSCAVPEDYIAHEREIRMADCDRVTSINILADSPESCLQRVIHADCADRHFSGECPAFVYGG